MQRPARFLHLLPALLGSLACALLAACGSDDPPQADAAGTPPPAAASATARLKLHKRHGPAPAEAGSRGTRIHIVQLSEPAVAAYTGGLPGLAATRPAAGRKLDSAAPAVAAYRSHLKARQAAVLAGVGDARSLYSYGYAFNGFAAELSEAQARKLAAMPGVRAVIQDEWRPLHTASTPAFLGLSGADGFWQQTGAKGENIVVGLIDTGIWPEQPSFSDHRGNPDMMQPQGGIDLPYLPLEGWRGTCQAGEQFGPEHCNRKLVGARFFNAGVGGDAGVKLLAPDEFNSPRDRDGHGTHTASTAAGNSYVAPTGPAAVFGSISGIAPRARIAMYKACWTNVGCAVSDSVAAIEQAIEDGVDVLNFSVGGSTTDLLDPVEQAFLRAADAGIFVAASAGNDGRAGSVEHPGPWLTTVAAGTHNRSLRATLTLGSGARFTGASSAAQALAALPLVRAADAGLPGAAAQPLSQCFGAADNGGTAVLDPDKVRGRIVVCDRGGSDRASKSQAVLQAGGAGMVLVNVSADAADLVADFHAVPTVHLSQADGVAVKAAAAAAGGASASLGSAEADFSTRAPFTAAFSSRGPTAAAGGSLLKPDLIAPGVDILAAVAPPGNGGLEFNVYQGTSMSSPHVAGIAALMKELHPAWSPMAIKSALMTSAGNVLDGADTNASVIFRQGAGHVQPRSAADPGLVFDAGLADWLGFLCGTQLPVAECTAAGVPVLDPADLNSPSIAIGALVHEQTVTRRVTQVGRDWGFYTASVTGLAGFDVTVAPSVLLLGPGQTRSFQVTFRRSAAAFNAHAGGQLTWTGSSVWGAPYRVRVPVVVQPRPLLAPAEASGSYTLKFGYTGPFRATARGLVAADTQAGRVGMGSQVLVPVTVPPGTTHARFALFDTHATAGSDLDLVVRDAAGNEVGGSFGVTSAEQVDLKNPPPGVYTVAVSGFFVPDGGVADFTLFSWALSPAGAGNMAVTAPAAAVAGGNGTIGLSFRGLTAGTKYLGAVAYDGGDAALAGPTLVRVEP
jgi:subtilisin family serine protease